MARRRKIKKLTDSECERFLAGATTFHRTLSDLQTRISTNCDDYRELSGLHDRLIDAIERVTGEEPPWMRTRSGELT